jgi:tRNA threonylcarbamoyladenosine biosynthesis protein TsaB
MRGVVLAFDTATGVATSALVRDGNVLGERASRPVTFLSDIDELCAEVGVEASELAGVAVGTGPGSFTGVRIGLAAAKGLALALAVPVAGVSTLDALAAGSPGAVPVVDAKRREVFAFVDGATRCLPPEELRLEPGTTCVGDGAVRYRQVLEDAGAHVPPDDSALHVPRARLHASLAAEFGPVERLAPIYVRVPDAESTRRW